MGVKFIGIQLLNSPLWTTTLVLSRDILFDGAHVAGDRRWPNNDGIDPVDSSDIIIRNTNISTGDDGICVVNHTPYGMSNITVSDCTIASSSAALKVTAFDKNATGNIYDILFRNINIVDTNRALGIMPRWGTGNIPNVRFENINLQTHYFSDPWWGSAEAIYVTSLSEYPVTNAWTGIIFDITFTNITGIAEAGAVIFSNYTGGLSPLYNLTFTQVNLTISQWYSNVSRPCHDWRPAPPPAVVYAPTNGFYVDGVNGGGIINTTIIFAGIPQPFWGTCYNFTTNLWNFQQTNLNCRKDLFFD